MSNKYYPGDFLRVGDRVVMNMDQFSRNWGSKAPEDGTEGTIIGKYRAKFHEPRAHIVHRELAPGVYHRDGVCIVHWDGFDPDPTVKDGYSYVMSADECDPDEYSTSAEELEKVMRFSRTSDHHMQPLDKVEYERRRKENRVDASGEKNAESYTQRKLRLENCEYIGELPETEFWEDDRVILKDVHSWPDYEGTHIRIFRVIYHRGDSPAYMLQWYDNDTGVNANRGSTDVRADEISLVERGNVWKHYNDQPKSFASLEEEVDLAFSLGQYEEIRNPATKLHSWSKYEILDGIAEGVGDYVNTKYLRENSTSLGLFRFPDEDLGSRVRASILKQFGRSEEPAANTR